MVVIQTGNISLWFFICICLMISDIEHIFMYLFAHVFLLGCLGFSLFAIELYVFLVYFRYKAHCQQYILQIVSPNLYFSFYSILKFFCRAKVFHFEVSFIIFSFYKQWFGMKSKKILPALHPQNVPLFHFLRFYNFTFKSIISFELGGFLVYIMRFRVLFF